MAPRKKSQTSSDETPAVDPKDTVAATSGDDSLSDTAEAAETIASGPADSIPAAADEDSIELPEPEASKPEEDSLDASDTLTDQADTLQATSGDDTVESVEGVIVEETAPEQQTTHDDSRGTDGPAAPPPPSVVEVRRSGGFVPMVLGGIVAGAIGYGIAYYQAGGQDYGTRIDAQDQAIADLRDTQPAPVDLSALEGSAESNTAALSDLSGRVDALTTRLDEMDGQMAELARAPLDNAVSQEAVEAYEEELARLQDAMRAQRAEVEQMVANAQTMQADADAQTARTEARAALTAIMAAFDSGEGYSDPLESLRATGQQVPEALEANADGIPTLAELRAEFPAAARAALARTRGAGNESVGDFFRTQLGIRSLEPKAGDDPDAVLSRAEAAVADGDLSTALTEIGTLPPEAQSELSAWAADAETRLTTVEAARALMAELNSN
ncbi:COG4223 family protein [Pseudooceanicola onchidii]|uniref:COG4223 family protein n=1 Tax=Pseudooceanicola onchidii TaxID=2562279 RepID=UPI00145B4DCF|nr:hypothetical protein [Pseudooceanicola onchidii]